MQVEEAGNRNAWIREANDAPGARTASWPAKELHGQDPEGRRHHFKRLPLITKDTDVKLPNSHEAYIPYPKLVDYLLSEVHSVGRIKARFFRSVGFDETNVQVLEQNLLAICRSEPVVKLVKSQHGAKYIIDGTLETPSGVGVRVTTVWIIEQNESVPRFVTAYPE